MPLLAIQQLLGHANITTTTLYTRVSADDLARMMAHLKRSKGKLRRTYLLCGYEAPSLTQSLIVAIATLVIDSCR
jgi:uncharacterized protein YbjT (DUF2867 family)